MVERTIPREAVGGQTEIRFDEANGLRIGVLATLDAISGNSIVRERYPLLFTSISAAALPWLGDSGTIGGNLCQDSGCRYYRGDFHCWLKGGEVCHARDGDNARHAIFGGGPCYAVHPSDPATALVALEAEVTMTGPDGEKTLPLERFFQRPREDSRRLNVLRPDETLVEVRVPAPAPGARATYLKATEEKVRTFGPGSVAARLVFEGDLVRDARVVLGGVAPSPWRLPAVDVSLQGRRLDDAAMNRASELAAAGAQPLALNALKVPLVKGIVRAALSELRG